MFKTMRRRCGDSREDPIAVEIFERTGCVQRLFRGIQTIPVCRTCEQSGIRFDQIPREVSAIEPFLHQGLVTVRTSLCAFGLIKKPVDLRIRFHDSTLPCGLVPREAR